MTLLPRTAAGAAKSAGAARVAKSAGAAAAGCRDRPAATILG